jgi:uncharacterized protein (TIGR02996 family)
MPFPDEGFFHALQQGPQDDALRLVFADFLEDRGDEPSTAHAELIRVQVRLAALSPLTRAEAEQVAQLRARQDELLARWQRAWLGDWAEALHGCTFRRGLVEAVHADASVFLDNAAEWFAEWPTLTVAKLTRAGNHLPELASSPWLAHLRGLDLANNGIDAAGLAHLTASRFICLLQALDMSENPIGLPGAKVLAEARLAEELREFHLARCGLWHQGLMALIDGPPSISMRWRRLDLSGNGLNRLCLVRLADSPLMRNLEALDLSGNPLDDHGASVLADSPSSGNLIDLGLCDTGTGDVEVTALAGSSNLKRLRSLDLRRHRCGWLRDRNGRAAGGIAALARSPLLSQLQRLLLGRGPTSNGWTAEVLSAIRPNGELELTRDGWVSTLLRESRYLIPSQLVECDIEELWWLGDTRNRERLPAAPWVADWLEQFPDLLDRMDRRQVAVLRLRYAPDRNHKGLKEIGDQLGLPANRVRDIESAAIVALANLVRELPGEAWY